MIPSLYLYTGVLLLNVGCARVSLDPILMVTFELLHRFGILEHAAYRCPILNVTVAMAPTIFFV